MESETCDIVFDEAGIAFKDTVIVLSLMPSSVAIGYRLENYLASDLMILRARRRAKAMGNASADLARFWKVYLSSF